MISFGYRLTCKNPHIWAKYLTCHNINSITTYDSDDVVDVVGDLGGGKYAQFGWLLTIFPPCPSDASFWAVPPRPSTDADVSLLSPGRTISSSSKSDKGPRRSGVEIGNADCCDMRSAPDEYHP